MTTTTISYRKNPAYSERNTPDLPRLFAQLDLTGFGVSTRVEALAIYYRKLDKPVGPVRVVYSTRVAGLLLEAGNLNRLEELIDDTLKKIVRLEKLPEYFFQVEDSAWPIYHIGDEYTTRYPGGPIFTTPDIAGLRRWLGDHFKAIGRIQQRREVNLVYLSSYDLQLYAPYCVLRTPDEDVPDIPIFPIIEKNVITLMAPINSHTEVVDFSAGKGIFALFDDVSSFLTKEKLLNSPYDLTIRKLSGDAWQKLEKNLSSENTALVYTRDYDGTQKNVSNPVFKEGELYIAARANRLGNYVLYVAPSLNELQVLVGKELSSYGALQTPNDVKTVSNKS